MIAAGAARLAQDDVLDRAIRIRKKLFDLKGRRGAASEWRGASKLPRRAGPAGDQRQHGSEVDSFSARYAVQTAPSINNPIFVSTPGSSLARDWARRYRAGA